jgi:hypothetical protein
MLVYMSLITTHWQLVPVTLIRTKPAWATLKDDSSFLVGRQG